MYKRNIHDPYEGPEDLPFIVRKRFPWYIRALNYVRKYFYK